MIPDMRAAGIDDATLKVLLQDNPAEFLSLHG
jgi:phosphotriesterase-related protein